jgi:hypothetical protein
MNPYQKVYYVKTMTEIEKLHCLGKGCMNTTDVVEDTPPFTNNINEYIKDWYCKKHSQYDVISEILEPFLYDDVIWLCLQFYGKDSKSPQKFIKAITQDHDSGHSMYEERLAYSSYIGDWVNVEFMLNNYYFEILPFYQEICVIIAMHSGYTDLATHLMEWFNGSEGNMFTKRLD